MHQCTQQRIPARAYRRDATCVKKKQNRIPLQPKPSRVAAFVFGNRFGERVKSIRTAWENAREAAGLDGFQLRDLRHEAASRFEEAGVLTTDVSKFLGHRNLSTTTRYLNTTSRRLRLAESSRRESNPNVLQILAKALRNPVPTQTMPRRRPRRASRCFLEFSVLRTQWSEQRSASGTE
jgi:hypothetical protein